MKGEHAGKRAATKALFTQGDRERELNPDRTESASVVGQS